MNTKNTIALFLIVIGLLIYLSLPSQQIGSTAQNRAGIREGVNCYCDNNTGWCEGLKVNNNQSYC